MPPPEAPVIVLLFISTKPFKVFLIDGFAPFAPAIKLEEFNVILAGLAPALSIAGKKFEFLQLNEAEVITIRPEDVFPIHEEFAFLPAKSKGVFNVIVPVPLFLTAKVPSPIQLEKIAQLSILSELVQLTQLSVPPIIEAPVILKPFVLNEPPVKTEIEVLTKLTKAPTSLAVPVVAVPEFTA